MTASPIAKRCETCQRTFSGAEAFCPFDAQALVTIASTDPMAGQTIGGRYLLNRVVGRGGMGVVYAATQTAMGREVAVKLIRPVAAADPKAVERFHAEARLTSGLRTPHVAAVHDFGQSDDGTLYLVMELLVGRTLRERLEEGPLTLAQAAPLWDQVGRGLSEAHASGLVHRDIKPSNVFLASSVDYAQFVKILDLGVAVASTVEGTGESPVAGVTGTGEVPGTPAYLSPERIRGEPFDARADVYALGVMMYESLCGERPFGGVKGWDALRAHLDDDARPLHEVRPDLEVPGPVVDLIWRCLAKNPQLRPADGAAFRVELMRALSSVGTVTWSHETGLGLGVVADATMDTLSHLRAPVTAGFVAPASAPATRGRRGRAQTLVGVATGVLGGFLAGWMVYAEPPDPAGSTAPNVVDGRMLSPLPMHSMVVPSWASAPQPTMPRAVTEDVETPAADKPDEAAQKGTKTVEGKAALATSAPRPGRPSTKRPTKARAIKSRVPKKTVEGNAPPPADGTKTEPKKPSREEVIDNILGPATPKKR